MAALRRLMADATTTEPRTGIRLGTTATVCALLVLFVLFWTVFASLARYNLDIHGDMVENFAWGIGWQLGYYKHPPLYSWISAAWLSVFPRTNFFYHMLSMTSVAVAAFGMWRISTRFFDEAQQIILVAIVFFLPPLTFLSINYNATSAMAPFWAFALLFYIRTLEGRRPLDAFMFGLICGLAMLAKYHSVVFILAMFVHAVADRQARTLFRTTLPLFAVAGALIPIIPHVYWLFDTSFMTIRYAAEQGSGRWSDTLWSAAQFIPAIILYAIPGLLLTAMHRYPADGQPLVAWPQLRAFRATVEGRALLAAAILPTVITILLGLVLDAQLSSLWSIPFFVFVPFLMVAALPRPLADRHRLIVPGTIAAFGVIVLLLAPTMKRYTLAEGRSNSAVPIERVAKAVQQKWRAHAKRPLRIAGGETNFLANGMSFYARDRPYAIQAQQLAVTPWVTPEEIERDGAVFVCNGGEMRPDCRQMAQRLLGRLDVREVFEVPMPKGAPGEPKRAYQVFMRMPSRLS